MNRPKTSLLATASTLVVLSLASVVLAQGFGRPGGGFGGPPGGFGGFGRGGGPPGFGGGESGSHLLTLSLDSAVWDEIKITDDQLGKITRLKAGIGKQSRTMRNTLREQRQAQEQQAIAAAGGNPEAAQAARDAARQAERAAMTENTDQVKTETEAALKKILNKPGQFGRVQAIDLQEAGPLVVARADVAKALNLTPDQSDQIQAVISQYTQGQRQVDQNRRDFFDSMRNNNNGGGPGGGGPGGGGPGGGGGPQANAAQGAPGGGGPGGGRGGRGGRGGNNTPPMSEEEQAARRAQFQEAMEKAQTDSTSIKEKTINQIGKILTKNQKTKFAGMQGKPFDVALLNNGSGPDNPFTASLGGRGRGGPGGPGGPGGRGPGGGGPPAGGTPGATAASGTAGGTPGTAATASGGGTTAATKSAQAKGSTTTAKAQPKTGTAKTGTAKTGSAK